MPPRTGRIPMPAGLPKNAAWPPLRSPHVFSKVKPNHVIAREEIFGPVVAIMHAKDFDDALRIANDSAYKLTGGVFTRKPTHIEKAKREFRVGNLYINRGNTGASWPASPSAASACPAWAARPAAATICFSSLNPPVAETRCRGFAPEL